MVHLQKGNEEDGSVLHIHRDAEMVTEVRFHLLGFCFMKQVTSRSHIKQHTALNLTCLTGRKLCRFLGYHSGSNKCCNLLE
jgi:hypothetical protein